MRIPAPLRKSFPLICLILATCLVLSACARPRQAPPMPLANLKIGTAFFTQPSEPSDMLAGYVMEDVPRIDEKHLNELDNILAEVLSKESNNTFLGNESALHCSKTVGAREGNTNNQAALRTWSAIGRCMKVDLLVVPQMLEFRERAGGELGVNQPARIVMDVFLVDVRNETLIGRSRFEETQTALTTNLLEADKFFQRGGKWISGNQLAREGMVKAVKELRL